MRRTWVFALLVSVVLAGSVLAWYGVRQEREFRHLVALGDASLARNQTSVAIEAFSGAVALKPDSMLGYLKRGDTYRRRGELAAALRDLRQASALDPASTRALELLGDINAGMGRFERAAEEYRRFHAIDDRSPRVLYKLGLASFRHGQSAAAIEALRHALSIDDRFAEAHYLLGVCLRNQRRDAEAVRALSHAVSLNPAYAPAREELADLLFALGRHRESLEQLEALAAIEPARVERFVAVGLAYARLGRPDEAILVLRRAAERVVDDGPVYTAIGRVWLEVAEARADHIALDKAIEALEPAAARNDAPGDTLGLYGRALFLSGDTAAAERVLVRATTTLPTDARSFLYLAASAQRLRHSQVSRAATDNYTALVAADGATVSGQLSTVLALQRRLGSTGVDSSPDRARP